VYVSQFQDAISPPVNLSNNITSHHITAL